MKRIQDRIAGLYESIVLCNPVATLAVIATVVAGCGWFAKDFALDASSDSLVLERDADLEYYRTLRARYGSDDYLIVTYSPQNDLFSDAVLADLEDLRDKLRDLGNVASVTSILDVPLVMSPPVKLRDIESGLRRLEDPDTDRQMARTELTTSPLYRDLIISSDARTTALTVTFPRNERLQELRDARDSLRAQARERTLSEDEKELLATTTTAYGAVSIEAREQQAKTIEAIRQAMQEHQDVATLHAGGVPMIVADSIRYIRSDLVWFGTAVFSLLILILALAFRKRRWTVLPLLTCVAACLSLLGLLGLLQWRVTVVSSNFVSLVLILCLALTLHFIVRFRELHEKDPGASQFELVSRTTRKIFVPCLYTALTTIVAFGSLLVSGIRPVIDFGMMMAIGVVVSMLLAFTLFPAALMLMKPGEPHIRKDLTSTITGFFATVISRHANMTLVVWLALTAFGIAGLNKLSTDNRFIDYYKKSTEIYRGMQLIDRELGGTTPLDVIIDAPENVGNADEQDEEFVDEFDDIYADDSAGSGGFSATSYWYNSWRIEKVMALHEYLDGLADTGKVISLATTANILQQLEPGVLEDNLALSIIYAKLPAAVREELITPYISDDGQQLRFSVRVFETDPQLNRNALLREIRSELRDRFELDDSQIHLNGMLVLYNNMLQSLFSSQIQTLGGVIAAIFLMFVVLFRSIKIAVVAIMPTAVSAAMVLGLMGWLGIPLDLMTITIAAIAIGIGVDDTIHYVHRFRSEFAASPDYWDAVKRSHRSIGRAMYYTSITVMLGFSILVLSKFVPTMHFGILTSLAMALALLANITLLPVLLVVFRATGKEKSA